MHGRVGLRDLAVCAAAGQDDHAKESDQEASQLRSVIRSSAKR